MNFTASVWIRNVLVGVGLAVLAGNIYNSIQSTGLIDWNMVIKETVMAVGLIVGGVTTVMAHVRNLNGDKLTEENKDEKLDK